MKNLNFNFVCTSIEILVSRNLIGYYAQSDFAFSNLRPLDLTLGLVWDPGTPGGGPKYFFASLSFDALRSTVFEPILIKLFHSIKSDFQSLIHIY